MRTSPCFRDDFIPPYTLPVVGLHMLLGAKDVRCGHTYVPFLFRLRSLGVGDAVVAVQSLL